MIFIGASVLPRSPQKLRTIFREGYEAHEGRLGLAGCKTHDCRNLYTGRFLTMLADARVKVVLCAVLACALTAGVYRFRKEPHSAQPFPDQEPPTAATVAAPAMPSAMIPPEAQGASDEELSTNRLADDLHDLTKQLGIVPGELLLTFRFPSDIADLRSRAASLGLKVLWSDARLNAARIAYTDADALAKELQSKPDVYEDVGPNFLMRIPGLPAEPNLELDASNSGGTVPFHDTLLESIGADQDRSQWGEGVTVAILDSGVLDHPSLENVPVTRIDLAASDEINGHGTAMASLVAGQVAPALGVAPASSLLDLRVTDENGVTNTGLVAQGILSAADRGADLINISLGSSGDSSVLRAAIEYAQERNIVVVAAAGNEQTTRLAYPAAYDGVISVGAVDAENTQAYFSNSGETLTISAPGVGIYSAYEEGQLVVGSGTSQATAITSGVVSALLSQGYRAGEIPRILQENAFETGAAREQVGAGVIRIP